MNGPSEEGDAAQKPLAEHPSLDEEAEKRRQYVAANRDRIRELNRLWRAEHLDRARELNRDSMRRAAARLHREAEVRARGRERAKRWRVEHPERRREYQQRWVAENREKVREYYNRYYEAHSAEVNTRAAARRDADPERTKQITGSEPTATRSAVPSCSATGGVIRRSTSPSWRPTLPRDVSSAA